MEWNDWLSILAVLVAGASAFYSKRQADSSREALELQKAARFSIEWLPEANRLRIRNEANAPAFMEEIEISRRSVTWKRSYEGARFDAMATLDVRVPVREFSPAPGDIVNLRYKSGRRSKALEWSDSIR